MALVWKSNIDAGWTAGPYEIYGVPPKGGPDGSGRCDGFSLSIGDRKIGKFATVREAVNAAENHLKTYT